MPALLRSDMLPEGSSYPSDIIVAITGGCPRTGPGMPPIFLETRELTVIGGTNTLTHIGLAVGTIFVVSA